jgi:hypothetical protein
MKENISPIRLCASLTVRFETGVVFTLFQLLFQPHTGHHPNTPDLVTSKIMIVLLSPPNLRKASIYSVVGHFRRSTTIKHLSPFELIGRLDFQVVS